MWVCSRDFFVIFFFSLLLSVLSSLILRSALTRFLCSVVFERNDAGCSGAFKVTCE